MKESGGVKTSRTVMANPERKRITCSLRIKCGTPESGGPANVGAMVLYKDTVACSACVKEKLDTMSKLPSPDGASSGNNGNKRRHRSARERLLHYVRGDLHCLARHARAAMADERQLLKRRMRYRVQKIAGDVRRFFDDECCRSRPEPAMLAEDQIAIRELMTKLERLRYHKRRAEKRAAWGAKHTPDPYVHRVQHCNTCGARRHRDCLATDNMMLFVLFALVMGCLDFRPPYMDRKVSAANNRAADVEREQAAAARAAAAAARKQAAAAKN